MIVIGKDDEILINNLVRMRDIERGRFFYFNQSDIIQKKEKKKEYSYKRTGISYLTAIDHGEKSCRFVSAKN